MLDIARTENPLGILGACKLDLEKHVSFQKMNTIDIKYFADVPFFLKKHRFTDTQDPYNIIFSST